MTTLLLRCANVSRKSGQWQHEDYDDTMDHRPTQLERAFQLAKSGRCGSIKDIRDQLRSEGYPTTQISGKTLAGQLQAHIQTARKPRGG